MTTTIKLIPGSGSTDGRGVLLSTTSTPGNLLHTALASAVDGNCDLVDVTVYNSDTVDRTITFECGGTTAPNDNRGGTVPAGEERTFTNIFVRHSLVLRAFASTANKLTAFPRVKDVVFA